MGLYTQIAKDLYKTTDYELVCAECHNNFPLPESRSATFLATGWPKCCGQTMSMSRLIDPRGGCR